MNGIPHLNQTPDVADYFLRKKYTMKNLNHLHRCTILKGCQIYIIYKVSVVASSVRVS